MQGGRKAKGKKKASIHRMPLISIITVVLNGEEHLEQAISSVVTQRCEDIEFIVVDGGSADGTIEILKKYDEKIDFWISEPDRGIYDAMNKGLDAARGEWIFFLGSDDRLYRPDTIRNVKDYMKNDISMLLGKIIYSDMRVVKSRLSLLTLLHNTVHHQGVFYNARLFKDWRYDPALKLISDYELNLRAYLNGYPYAYVDQIISVCNPEGGSRSELDRAFKETNIVRRRNLGTIANFILSLIYFVKFRIKSG